MEFFKLIWGGLEVEIFQLLPNGGRSSSGLPRLFLNGSFHRFCKPNLRLCKPPLQVMGPKVFWNFPRGLCLRRDNLREISKVVFQLSKVVFQL